MDDRQGSPFNDDQKRAIDIAVEEARRKERYLLHMAIRGLATMNQECAEEAFYFGVLEAAAFAEQADDEEIAAAISYAPKEASDE
jgi:hypothetical protein